MTGRYPILRPDAMHRLAWTRFALFVVLFVVIAPLWGSPARAAPDDWLALSAFCHASTAIPAAAHDHDVPGGVLCGGDPLGYQQGSLWLLGGARLLAGGGRMPMLMIHSSRFDRMLVGFRYADGVTVWQDVRSGDFGEHWRLGGQIGFAAPLRDAPVAGVVLRFDHMASAEGLRLRLVTSDRADLQAIALACVIGAALMLLLIGVLYNLVLAVAVRRMFPAIQAIWSTAVAAWGAIWSQLHLFVLPGLAGTVSAQIGAILGCIVVMTTAFGLVSAIERGLIPVALRRLLIGLALLAGACAALLAVARGTAVDQLSTAVGVLVTVMLGAVAASLVLAWRRGSVAARAYAGAWLVPLAVMGLLCFVDVRDALWGGGPHMVLLLGAAWQTLWLTIAAARRFNLLRHERDLALAAERVAHELARRDPLTGLSNRRGFVERIVPLMAGTGPVALLLIDVDRFKLINDAHGHDTGDVVLTVIAQRLARWDGPAHVVGRLGGEEFAMLVTGFGRFAVHSFAEGVRQAIAACDHVPQLDGVPVTISVGLGMAAPGDDFATLYRIADGALYEAKHQGRNRVVAAREEEAGPALRRCATGSAPAGASR
jgi:diguanylate cyclase (GGDEF)-like protein